MINATPFIPPIQRVPAEALIEIPGIEQQPENRTASICKSSIWQLLKASTITTITATACSFIHQQTTQSTESPIETATQMGNLTPTMINSACYSGGCYVSSIFVGMIEPFPPFSIITHIVYVLLFWSSIKPANHPCGSISQLLQT